MPSLYAMKIFQDGGGGELGLGNNFSLWRFKEEDTLSEVGGRPQDEDRVL